MSTLAGSRLRVHPIWKYSTLLLLTVVTGILYAKKGPLIYLGWFIIPIAIITLVILYRRPKLNLYVVLFLSFFMAMLVRYVPVNIPWSLGVDVFLVLAVLLPAIKNWHNTDYYLASRSLTALMGLWMLYILLQVFNPEAVSSMAWLYVMRGIALYPLLIVVSTLVLFNTKKDFKVFLHTWMVLSLLGVFWGIKQDTIGVSHTEQMWLDAGAKGTHILFGQLRVFSYYYDAGTFGAAMGQISIISLILFLGPFRKKLKTIYLIVGLLSFYALMISGTRGALAVPAMGAIAYLVMVRKFKLVLLGLFVIGLSFGFLKYTSIGSGNYTIMRLRSALNPEDASLNTRFRNRQALSEYLRGKPFGGGVGSSGYWGRRFSRGTWLSQFETDGLYTMIRAETGIVGRNLYVLILLIIFFRGMVISMNLKDPENQFYSMAILAGYAGILLANYGNSVMTQFPNNFMTFVGLAFVFSMKWWNEKGEIELPDRMAPIEGARTAKSSWSKLAK